MSDSLLRRLYVGILTCFFTLSIFSAVDTKLYGGQMFTYPDLSAWTIALWISLALVVLPWTLVGCAWLTLNTVGSPYAAPSARQPAPAPVRVRTDRR